MKVLSIVFESLNSSFYLNFSFLLNFRESSSTEIISQFLYKDFILTL